MDKWDSDSIKRFWDYYSRRENIQGNYFSLQVGKGIARFLSYTKYFTPGMRVLDFGCGPGYLFRQLLSMGFICYGYDYSKETVKVVNEEYKNYKNWKGATTGEIYLTNYPDGFFDFVTCIETLEHALDKDLEKVLEEILRILRPGGIGFFTVPADENLLDHTVYCPFCNSTFHSVQHLRSFNSSSLSSLLCSHGFKILFCKNLNFQHYQITIPRWTLVSISTITQLVFPIILRFVDRILFRPWHSGYFMRYNNKNAPHLCALVKKNNDVGIVESKKGAVRGASAK
jgi:SAM-dependent methyltransferase